MKIKECALIKINDVSVSQTIVDEVFTTDMSDRLIKMHPIGDQADKFIARDPGDSLIFIKSGVYKFWDSITGNVTVLGKNTSDFVIGYEK
jgi:hypothetical protein